MEAGQNLAFPGGILRPWRLDDVASLSKHANNRNIWIMCSDRFSHPYTLDDAVGWINFCQSTSKPGQPALQFSINITENPEGPVGGIGFVPRQDVQRFTYELGYWLSEEYWGRGIMTKVLDVVLAYAWPTFPHLRRIEALVYNYNTRSLAILGKFGFEREGVLKDAAYKNGRFVDSLVYGLTRGRVPGALAWQLPQEHKGGARAL